MSELNQILFNRSLTDEYSESSQFEVSAAMQINKTLRLKKSHIYVSIIAAHLRAALG